MSDWVASPAKGALEGELRVPSDKSITHRAIMLGALASGTTQIERPLMGEDARSTIRAMEQFGAKTKRVDGVLMVTGIEKPHSPSKDIDCGNAGTLIRLLSGAICGRNVKCVLDGDGSLRKRPMKRIEKPLRQMGADLDTSEGGVPPISIKAVEGLRRIEHTLDTPSAQVKSAILLAGLVAEGGAMVEEPLPCRDHTELILPSFGATVRKGNRQVEVLPCKQLVAAKIKVPADISAAAFFLVAATIVPGSEILLREVCVNPTRAGVIALLQKMGANIQLRNLRKLGNEDVADIVAKHAPLNGISIDAADVPAAIDELPVVMVAATAAEGQTRLSGAEELRAKESDRISAMAKALAAIGIDVTEHPDGMDVTGGKVDGGEIDSFGDHRIAMAMATAALVSSSPIRIKDCENVATSFPDFPQTAETIGWQVG